MKNILIAVFNILLTFIFLEWQIFANHFLDVQPVKTKQLVDK